MAATTLQRHGMQVTVVDKGYGIGGRLASRSVAASSEEGDKGFFDYGTQYLTASHPQFQRWVDEWLRLGWLRIWSDGFYDANGQYRRSERPFYCGVSGNRSLAQQLAKDLDVRNQTRIVQFRWQDSAWTAISATGDEFRSDALLLTSPVPQTLQLLEDSEISLPPEQRPQLEQVTYRRCIAVLVVLEQNSKIPQPGGIRFDDDGPLIWAASNTQKGISPHRPSVTLHASHEFSLRHWDDDHGAIAHLLCEAASPWLGSAVVAYHVHRWKYSQPQILYPDAFASIVGKGPLLLAGDAFQAVETASSVERGSLSGLAAANHLLIPYKEL